MISMKDAADTKLLAKVLLSIVLCGCSLAYSTTVKSVERVLLTFPAQDAALSVAHNGKLAQLAPNIQTRCSEEVPGLVVAIEAAIDRSANSEDRALAVARAKAVRQELLALGVPSNSAFDETAWIEDLTARRVAGEGVRVGSDAVAVELVCNPR